MTPASSILAPSSTAVLRTERLVAGYRLRGQADRKVLGPVDCTFRAGDLVVLLGPNGAGKSTLLRTLAGVQPPLAGVVRVGEEDVHRLAPRDLARRMSLVLTERVAVGSLRAADLVAMGRYPHTDWTGRLRPDDEARVRDALRRTRTGPLAGRRVDTLSDGERQKVMIARALAQATDVVVLDEPTAHLDVPNRLDVMRVLRDLAHESGRLVVLSTHDLALALQTADRIALIGADGTLRIDLPETLVLEGAVDRAFGIEGAGFDPATGTFRLTRPPGGRVGLSADDETLGFWTRRALERLGWAVDPDGGDVVVDARRREGGFRWTLRQAGAARHFADLEPLLQAVQSLDRPEGNDEGEGT